MPRGNGFTTTAELNPYRLHGPLPVSNQYTYGSPIPKLTGTLIAIPASTPACALALGENRGDACSSLVAIAQPYAAAIRHQRLLRFREPISTTR